MSFIEFYSGLMVMSALVLSRDSCPEPRKPPKESSTLDLGASQRTHSGRLLLVPQGWHRVTVWPLHPLCSQLSCELSPLPFLFFTLGLFDFYGFLFCLKAMLCYVILRLPMPVTLPTSFPGVTIHF